MNSRFVTLLAWALSAAMLVPNVVTGALCSNTVPGLDKMAHGIDITTFDLFSTSSTEGLESKVVGFTCDQSRILTINGINYDVPDQVDTITAIPGGIYNSRTKLVKTYSDARKTVSENLGTSGDFFGKFGFSASRSLTSIHNSIVNQSRYIELVTAHESARQVQLVPDFILQPGRNFQYYVDNLLGTSFDPAANRTAAEGFRNFIRYFGTHYFESANFGGLLLVEMETSSDYYYSHTESQVKAQAEASFFKVLKLSGGVSTSTTSIDEQFVAMTSVSTRYFGGTTNLLAPGGLASWQPTVTSAPWLFSGRLAPLSSLVRDETKREALDRAIADHTLRALLTELWNLLAGRLATWTAGRARLQELQQQVTSMKTRVLLTTEDVQSLSEDVYSQATAPLWFTDNVQLCYNWRPDGDSRECTGPQGRLCASPGQMTSEYRDDTGHYAGGCQMSWGITAVNADDWFNSVQVCYRWYAEDDRTECQSTGVANGEFCASVNSMTEYYRDDTDRRSGGCQMSWRLVVPDSAPAWALNLRFCFHWRPDGDATQCWGVSRELCAVAGEWTSYYRDDTNLLPGGCQLRWGITGPLA